MVISTTKQYRKTLYASYLGYSSQAIVNNFAPLLFVTFQSSLGIDLGELTTLISILFATQLVVDLLASRYTERIGYRISILFGTLVCALGLASLGILPLVFKPIDPMIGLVIATIIYGTGGGLIEVLVSPIVQGTPNDKPDQAMSALHTSYSFGQVVVVIVSTTFFVIFGRDSWTVLALLWALVPLTSACLFWHTPLPTSIAQEPEIVGSSGNAVPFYKRKAFFVFLAVMMGGGALEMSLGQWSSTFAEETLGLSKVTGDLAGPAAFALMMGMSRLFYTRFGHRIDLRRFVLISAALCCVAFLIVGLVHNPFIALFAFALGGWAVGIITPGSFVLAAEDMPHGGMTMFGLFSTVNDFGNGFGPAFVGIAADLLGGDLHQGFLIASIFPISVFFAFLAQSLVRKRNDNSRATQLAHHTIHSIDSEIYPD